MGYNENFSRAVFQRDVPGSKLGDYMRQVMGKTDEEHQRLLEQFAKEIERTYPYLPGKEPIHQDGVACRATMD